MTEEIFEGIVDTAIWHVYLIADVASYAVKGYTVKLSFHTEDPEMTFLSQLDFANDGHVDGHYTFTSPGRDGINGPKIVGNEIMRLIQEGKNGEKVE